MRDNKRHARAVHRASKLAGWPAVHAIARAHRESLRERRRASRLCGHRRSRRVAMLVELAGDPKIVAIGETGLDYFRLDRRPRLAARAVSHAHPRGARRAASRSSSTRARRPPTRSRSCATRARGDAGGVMHCFTETWDVARAALDLGFHISFSGIVTFKNAAALEGCRAARAARPDADRNRQPIPRTGALSRQAQPARVRPACRRGDRAAARSAGRGRSQTATSDNFFKLFGVSPNAH